MRTLRWISICALLSPALLAGCADDGAGCAAPAEKKEDAAGAGAGGGVGGAAGGGRGGDIIISEKKSKKVPKEYQRKPREEEPPPPSPGPGAAPPAAKSAPAAKSSGVRGLPVMRVTRRKVDGIAGRVEVQCRVMASSSDGQCSSASNYAEIKEKCCPGGTVERCKADMRGVLLVGTGCEESKQ